MPIEINKRHNTTFVPQQAQNDYGGGTEKFLTQIFLIESATKLKYVFEASDPQSRISRGRDFAHG